MKCSALFCCFFHVIVLFRFPFVNKPEYIDHFQFRALPDHFIGKRIAGNHDRLAALCPGGQFPGIGGFPVIGNKFVSGLPDRGAQFLNQFTAYTQRFQ